MRELTLAVSANSHNLPGRRARWESFDWTRECVLQNGCLTRLRGLAGLFDYLVNQPIPLRIENLEFCGVWYLCDWSSVGR